MRSMTIPELYEYLCSPQFMDERSGNIFYNYYIYQYPASKEYEMRRQIMEFKENLERPSNFVNALVIDLFSVFCDFLRSNNFGPLSLLEDALECAKDDPDMVTESLTTDANSDEFAKFVCDRINEHMEKNDGYNKPYVFIHGIGKMFPYLRTNVFLTRYEKYNDTSRYKIILFYPGHQEGNSFSLFDVLSESHTYRATLLVNE